MTDSINLLYIMGHGYSGSTLLTFLLGVHPEIATVGEMGIAPRAKGKGRPDEFLCSCKTPIRECDFWQQVTEGMERRGYAFDVWETAHEFRARGGGLTDAVLRAVQRGPLFEAARQVALGTFPRARRELRRILRYNEALVRVVTAIKRCRTFLDSSKRPERAVYLRRVPSLDVKVIHLVRDGRAVSYSSMKNLGLGPAEAAESWIADNRSSEHARRYFPADRWMSLRYEDLCADPPAALGRIYRFAGVQPKNGAEEDFRAVEQHIIGNRMRLSNTSEIRLDERWKTALTAEQMQVIESRVGAMNRRYGYDGL